ncbi:MAG: alcohol dehydrogenase catalytic domain-containing protein, partial [Gammaproteobacteria bacterium]|nr:alcohol dehydrogenase catalytic domain-containing protein [Gammaproteobacteria bacterium]
MADKKMRAVIGRELGPVDNYELVETDVPQPRAHEVQIAVRVAGMGYVDALISRGLYQVKPQLPYCPGLEMAGTVSAVGSDVTSAKVGDRVCASAFGGA